MTKIVQLKLELAALEKEVGGAPTTKPNSETGMLSQKKAVEQELRAGKNLPAVSGKLLSNPGTVEGPEKEGFKETKPENKTKEPKQTLSAEKKDEKEDKAPPKEGEKPDSVPSEPEKAKAGAVNVVVTNRSEVLEEHGPKDQQKKLEAAAAKRASTT